MLRGSRHHVTRKSGVSDVLQGCYEGGLSDHLNMVLRVANMSAKSRVCDSINQHSR